MLRGWLIERRRAVVGVLLLLWAVGLAAFLILVSAYDLDFFGPVGGPWVLAFGSFIVTGAIITWQRPDHVIGPLFMVVGVVAPVANALLASVLGPFAAQPMALRTLVVAVGFAASSAMVPLLPLLIVLFPNGRLPSARWRWIWALTAAASVTGATTAFGTGGWGGDQSQALLGPPLDGRLEPLGVALSPVYMGLISGLLIASGVAAVVRYRRSHGTTRQQLKWLATAAIILAILAVGLIATELILGVPASTVNLVFAAIGVALVPVAVTIAILRHRLYDIDLVLNRAIVFGLLAAFITLMYVAVVVGAGWLVGDPSNVVLTVGATALVAAAFEPVRARVQGWANRAVYGRRASPYEVLAALAGEMGSVGAGEGELETMAALLADGTGADHTTVWVGVDGGLRAAACWPTHDPDDHPDVAVDGVTSGVTSDTAKVATHLELVRQDGELLGALSLDRRRDDPVTLQEQQLVSELAGQASLVLGNARLRARLQARLEELRSSRQRLVATQDEARRRLERDLHDGAQQQLVALKVKLGMAATIARKEEAGEAVTRALEAVSATADEAVDRLRTLARGIYPPLLEAEGLERAIAPHAATAPVPVRVRTEGLARYDRSVEATVFFCVLEALRNTAGHGDASAVDVVLEDDGDQLTFRVADDGRGFDPATTPRGLGLMNMADRLDALGGSFTVEAAPGAGVVLAGIIPVRDPVLTAAQPETIGT